MERAKLLQQLKQPKLIADIAAGSIAVLGLFGCFSESPFTRNLSIAALMAGVSTVGANSAIAQLYAECALNAMDKELSRQDNALELSEAQVSELAHKLEEWKAFWGHQQRHGEALKLQLVQAQTALFELRSENGELNSHIALLESNLEAWQQRLQSLTMQQERDRQQAQTSIEALAVGVKTTMAAAVVEYRDRLLSSIEATTGQRTDLVPQLKRLAAEVKHVATDHLNHITNLSPSSDLKAFVDEALRLLQQEFEELSALKVKYRNVINTGDKLHYQSQLAEKQVELDELQQGLTRFQQDFIPRSQHEAILSEFQVKKDEVLSSLAQQVEALEVELNGDTDAYMQKLLQQLDRATREIANLREQVDQLRRPQTFSPATRDDLRMGNQIIEYFWLHGILLDRAGSEYCKHEATLYFHSDRNPRLILTSELNEHAEKLTQITRCHNEKPPEFKYDPESGLMSIWLQLSQKPPVDTSAVLKTIGSAQDFLKYLSSNPISYRIIGDKGRGKTPLMAVMVAHFLKIGGRKGNVPNGMKMSKLLVGVSYPNADFSQKDKGRYPLEPFLFARTDEQCKKAIAQIYQDYQMRRDPTKGEFVDNFFQLWVIDEADNTLDFSAEGSASKMRSIFNDGGHANIGWIFAGQSVNTRVLRGWTNDDRKKSTEIILEAAKIRAWAEEYGSDYYSSDRLKSLLANVDAIREVIEKENAAIGDEAKRLRIALVADPISPKLFLLPSFDSAEFDLETYLEVRREADGILSGTGSNLFQAVSNTVNQSQSTVSNSTIPGIPVESPHVGVCPECGMESSDRKGKPEAGKQRYFCKNPKCSKKTFTVPLKQLLNLD
ncbi:hypothetical protein [Trichocoleus sp. FACHB-262]|uniref:hypothetical protein n=1 Tax=Trichocoleus sp. FACHB-262 TaxID=2692869 RepID=UPI0016838D70|nr:hypothetical protein [Trichocoleus sp. FACHB-262]MBD2123277.1 hypothetical protein [Trichocoleus sp. FACHB-262]